MTKTFITVSREWHRPDIKTTISPEGISLAMDIEDFKAALIAELGPMWKIQTEKQITAKLDAAVENIIAGIKRESKKAIGQVGD
jgi:hypothetical protein